MLAREETYVPRALRELVVLRAREIKETFVVCGCERFSELEGRSTLAQETAETCLTQRGLSGSLL